MRQQKQNYILISAFLITVCAGIFLPGILLHYTFQANLNETKPVPKDYYNYSSSVISKNASNKLSEFEKIKLISGAWKSSQAGRLQLLDNYPDAGGRLCQKCCL